MITPAAKRILAHLQAHPHGDSITGIADAVRITQGCASQLVRDLDREGRVNKRRSAFGQGVIVTLASATPKPPEETVRSRLQLVREHFADPIVELTRQEAAQLIPGCSPVVLQTLLNEGYLRLDKTTCGARVYRRAVNV
ncbi:MarR family transcriptional regulator [Deinococcus peraridilitoris]|uniref:Uncharacterized protein n=1 Tax=Deinococcus peraridilitoris (strain DSM 19664 / LMG 22246 / CIP 109416 / KR-200) TaxID=937777 RepID=L0A282_DEIPD|nr:MarR family transcriptional regulator [Deinococcus peraridilitoris]AFZ67554.1 hypothetical protein Deipe_2058 [Deinococcus peraridilitoris DSM 19664]